MALSLLINRNFSLLCSITQISPERIRLLLLNNGLCHAHYSEIFKWPLWNKRLLYTDVELYIHFLIYSGVLVGGVSPLSKSRTWKKFTGVTLRLYSSPVCWHTRSGPNIWNIKKMVSTNQNCWRFHSSLPFVLIMQTLSEFSHWWKPRGQRRWSYWMLSHSGDIYSYSTMSDEFLVQVSMPSWRTVYKS